MIQSEKDIQDSEIRIIGNTDVSAPQSRLRFWGWIVLGIALLCFLVGLLLAITADRKADRSKVETYFDPQPVAIVPENSIKHRLGREIDSLARGFCEVRDTMINDIPLRIYIPHNADMFLFVGEMDKKRYDYRFLQRRRPISGAIIMRLSEHSCYGASRWRGDSRKRDIVP